MSMVRFSSRYEIPGEHIMRKWLLIFILILILFIPTVVHGQDQPTLSTLQVDLWPEYDRHSILVIYRIVLSPETSLPVDLSFRIPATAGDPNAVAARQMDGSLFNVTFDRQVDGDWAHINFIATTLENQLEYYDVELGKQGDQRSFDYLWPGDYAVDTMTVQVQQPFDAREMTISPSLGSGVIGNDGLTYYTAEVGSLPVNQALEISAEYTKPTNTLSAENLDVQPSAPIPETTTGSTRLVQFLPWILAILGAALIVGSIIWYWRTGKRVSAPRRRARTRRTRSEPKPESSEDGAYCHQCGNRALAGDRFCRSCGARMRTG
jgi:uncharacterized integral membrane protein